MSAFASLGQDELDAALAAKFSLDTPEWVAAAKSCRRQLEMVSSCIRPVAELNEASRRLTIDKLWWL